MKPFAWKLSLLTLILKIMSAENDTNYANGVDYEVKLLRKLENVLPKSLPPSDMLDRTIRVFVDINQISDVNEKDGYLTIQLWIYCAYGSPSAAWDPLEFGNTTEITVPQSTFWVADIS